jgi:uncharacterized protein
METSTPLMRQSPLDTEPAAVTTTEPPQAPSDAWKPSRWNARTIDEEGHIILWNSNTGALCVFNRTHEPVLKRYLTKTGWAGPLDSVGNYLRERGFIVPRDRNEMRQFQYQFGQQHYRSDTFELILLSSEDCNFRCKYCYEDFRRGTMLPSVRRNIKALLTQRASEIRNLGINWFGGEPLYGLAAIEDLGPFFVEMAETHGWHYGATMTTNGYLLTPPVAEKLLAWKINKFQITLDGPSEQHNQSRPGRDGSPTFETILANLRSLKQRDQEFVVRLRVNFDPVTRPHVTSLMEEVKDLFHEDSRFNIAFHPVGRWGGTNDEALDVCGVDEGREARAGFERQAIDGGLSVNSIADSLSFGSGVCYAARPFNFIIGADGTVMKCTIALDKQDFNIVGALREGGELWLDQEKLARWVEPSFEHDRKCGKCYLLPSCQGLSCPLIRFESGHAPCDATIKPDLHNALLKAFASRSTRGRIIPLRAS